jgi:hypothetical protein
MIDPIDHNLANNLRRWLESGQPQQWCEARKGWWHDDDGRALLASLWWSDFWPMDEAAVRAALAELAKPWNLGRWQASGQALQWIDRHAGAWHHDDWLALLESLRQSEFWPLDPDAVGALLEEQRTFWRNLRRWRQSESPQRWVEARQGCWNHADWLALVDGLQQSEFWPLDLTAVGDLLEQLKQAWHNQSRWQASGAPRRWVEERHGSWNDDAWRSLLESLQRSEFWPLAPAAVARLLEEHKREWWNLQRWRYSGLARRWVEAHQGAWNHDDWLGLLASLQTSRYSTVDPAALGRVLEEVRDEWRNLHRWQAAEAPGAWLQARGGHWQDADFEALLDALWQSEFWPLDPRAVRSVLEKLAADVDGACTSSRAAVYQLPPAFFTGSGRRAA